MSATDIKQIITVKNLRAYAGGRSFGRGEEYYENGAVGPVVEKNGTISAKVHGSHTYQVRLKIVPGEKGKMTLDHTCTCPVGCDGDFCKHCVALGLAWLEKYADLEEADRDTPPSSSNQKAISDVDIRTWLESQDPKLILEMLMVQIGIDARLREELVLKIAKEKAVGIDLDSYRKGMRAAFQTGRFVDYYHMSEFTDGISDELDRLERLLDEGFAAETMQLCEQAFELADDALQNCDDSGGYFSDIAARLGSLHLDACAVAKPDPLQLARRLFTIELRGSDMDFCYGAADVYKDVLVREGLAEYRRLAEAEWTRAAAQGSAPSRVIAQIMESLARADGDVDALIAIKKRTLTSSYSFLDIAEICRKAGRDDEALEWAEKGVQAFPKGADSRLLDFLAEEYHRRQRYEEAYRIYWTQFADHPALHHYTKLMDYAKKIKRDQRARDEALALLRETIQRDKANRRGTWGCLADHSRLVEVFLWEKDAEAAWNEANLGGCSNQLWLTLAKRGGRIIPPMSCRFISGWLSRSFPG